MKSVAPLAAEADIAALFINTRQVIPETRTLEEMGHKQPPTLIKKDNTTSLGFVTKTLNLKATKSTDVKYWRQRGKSDQEQFQYHWSKGKGNCADYWTKYFCAAYHRETRPSILTSASKEDKLRIRKGLAIHQFRESSRVC